FFPLSSLSQGKKLLENLPYSHCSYDWAGNFFHPNYQASFVPNHIPTLIIGSEHDHLTPLSLFSQNSSWKKENIKIECLNNSGHFPWLDAHNDLQEKFTHFFKKINL